MSSSPARSRGRILNEFFDHYSRLTAMEAEAGRYWPELRGDK
jgi:hypothetical protein